MVSTSMLVTAFLKNMNNYFGDEVGLYKATEAIGPSGVSVIIAWKEQTLNASGNIVEINCP